MGSWWADNQSVVAALAVGGLGVALVERGFDFCATRRRVAASKGALRAEIALCGEMASTFLSDEVASPLYRLPSECFDTGLTTLLKLGKLDQRAASHIIAFYSEVRTLNRGLDEVATLFAPESTSGRDTKLQAIERNQMKAGRIQAPSGDLYWCALAAVD